MSVRYTSTASGSGPPVVLLHAWAESLRAFDRLRPLLPTTSPVLAFDQRGHGGSDKPAAGYDLMTLVDDVLAFFEVLDLPPVVLVGSSSGGYLAQQVAVSHAERVAGLVLVGAPLSLQGHPPFLDEVAELVDPIDPAWMRESLAWFPRLQPVPEWYLDDRVQDGLACPAHVLHQSLLGLIDATPPTRAGTIAVPTTILWGEQDGLLPRPDADLLHAAIAGSRLVVLPDTGHLVLWEQPAHVASEVRSLIRQLSRAGQSAGAASGGGSPPTPQASAPPSTVTTDPVT